MPFEIDEIKRRRKKLGLTQKKLAELVGVSQPLIARIESGNIDPKLSLVRKIFEVLEEMEGKTINARSIMYSPIMSVTPDTPLNHAIELMMKHGISQMPVIENERVLGSITESSIVRVLLERGMDANMKVRKCMEAPFPLISPKEKLESISRTLLTNQALLVTEGGRIIGIITKHDVMKALRE